MEKLDLSMEELKYCSASGWQERHFRPSKPVYSEARLTVWTRYGMGHRLGGRRNFRILSPSKEV
jgi:hypothetical protein